MEPLYKGHIGTLETVLYIEVVFNPYAYLETRQVSFIKRFHCRLYICILISVR